jgi:hypothetical protein
MTNSINFRPHPGADLVQTSAPMLRAFQTIAAYQVEHSEIRLTNSGAWNRHCIEWVVRRMNFPNWTAEKLYSVNKVLDEYDVPPLEYLRVLLTSLRLGRKMGAGWRLTKPGMAPSLEIRKRRMPPSLQRFCFGLTIQKVGARERHPPETGNCGYTQSTGCRRTALRCLNWRTSSMAQV